MELFFKNCTDKFHCIEVKHGGMVNFFYLNLFSKARFISKVFFRNTGTCICDIQE